MPTKPKIVPLTDAELSAGVDQTEIAIRLDDHLKTVAEDANQDPDGVRYALLSISAASSPRLAGPPTSFATTCATTWPASSRRGAPKHENLHRNGARRPCLSQRLHDGPRPRP